ncbi:MAG TPA: redox-sensing transcriptional repressor Rex [Longimicrobiales bacterium]|nr:redox-sensing transcriptional repressor Rex [Longimicrobiales bacterium]
MHDDEHIMKKVSESTVARLSVYLRLLTELSGAGVTTLASEELARRCGTSAAQVRKDLSFFGTFGKRGLGYSVPELTSALRGILGLERRWRVALIGAGKIGAALMAYQDFRRQGFDIVAVFDADPAKVGREWHGLVVQSDADLQRELERIEIAIVAVPAEAAQTVVNRVIEAGVRAILNFAPTKLSVPDHVAVKTVNMALELEGLSYALVNEARGSRRVTSRPAASRG